MADRVDVSGAGVPPDWIDRLVELHVLAASGDRDAEAEAAEWMAQDGEVRRVWEHVERACNDVWSSLPRRTHFRSS